jgi:nicotinamidase-related amidase
MQIASRALIVIDVQNDYFSCGAYPLWNTEETLARTEEAIGLAAAQGTPVIFVQHLAQPRTGAAPFFTAGTPGAEIHPRLRAAAPDAVVVVKEYADSFVNTVLEETLGRLGVEELLICGMMTQNCVTHTAISKSAEKYKVTVLADCCTTVDAMIHNFALRALALRVRLESIADAFREQE